MAVTTRLSDGSAGDTSTTETSTTLVNVPPGIYCALAGPIAILTAHAYLGTRHAITSWRITGGLVAVLSSVGDACAVRIGEEVPSTVGSAVATLEYSLDGSTWTQADTVALTVPLISVAGDISENFDITRSVASFTACQVRIVITYTALFYSVNFSLSATTWLSDIRFAATDTGTACSDPDDNGGGGGGGSDCGCDSWTRAAGCTSDSGTRAGSCTTDSGTRATGCTSDSGTRRTC